MNLSDAPSKIILPFANNGGKNSIPVASQIPITPGAASWYDGFPPLTRTAKAAGGVPPFGLDMNGVMFSISALSRWANAGAGFVYDNTFAINSDVAGYPQGARILRTDGTGYWLNTIDGNEVDPESASIGAAVAAGWVPDFTNGIASVTMTNANVTLTPAQYGKPVIVITGLLTGSLNLIFPAIQGKWYVINNTTGAFTITCKTNAGTGFVVSTLGELIGDGTNIYNANKDSALLTVANVFTQIQSAVTAAQFDSTTKLATTAFVQRAAGASLPDIKVISTSTALAATDIGKLIYLAAASTTTLPALNTSPEGSLIHITSAFDGAIVARAGSDDIRVNSGATLTSIIVNNGQDLVLYNDTTSWLAIEGSARFPYAAGIAAQTAVTVQTKTSGSGTYTTPALCKRLNVRMIGGGGGGGGGGTGGGGGGNGGTTSFNSITVTGGTGGASATGGNGGSAGTGTTVLRIGGGAGASGIPTSTATTGGAVGGNGVFGGNGSGSSAGETNSGGGGGGGNATAASVPTGGGGGAGEYAELVINSPAGTYSYAVGAAGSAGTTGTNGSAGTAGGSGLIMVTEYY